MRRKQIYLDDASERALKRLAARTGRSEASHIREALQRYLADASVGAIAAPEQRDEGARIGVDDPHARSFGAP